MSRLCSITAASLLWLSAGVGAADTARAQLDSFSRGLDTLRGGFEQVVIDPDGRETDRSSGTLALKAPRQFRWSYEQPFPQLIVADGTNVWIHDVDLQQVTVRGQSGEEAQSPLSVLTDLSLLDRQFAVEELPREAEVAWLRLTSKAKEPAFVSCDLGFRDQQLVAMVLRDNLGQRNQLSFTRWDRNAALAPALFAFAPPKGVDVVGSPVPAAEVFPLDD